MNQPAVVAEYPKRLADRWKSLLVGLLFFVTADTGLLSSLGAWVYVAIVAVVWPRFSAILLVLIGITQDAPGLANQWWYPAFATAGISTLVYYLIATRGMNVSRILRDQRIVYCSVFALCVVAYGLLVSVIQNDFGGYMQSAERPPILLAGLACFMIVTALISLRLLSLNPELKKGFVYVLILAVIHGAFVLIMQAVADKTLFHSPEGVQNILGAAQLTNKTFLGIPRLTGTYLTPNGFGLCMALLLALLAYLKWHDHAQAKKVAWAFLMFGALISVATLSKDVTLFFMGCSFLLFSGIYGLWRTTGGLVLLCIAAAVVVDVRYGSDIKSLAAVFRIPTAANLEQSYRFQAWNYVIAHFTFLDWITGTGLAYWPTMFENALGFKLADPHSWILALPGEYGVIGLLFYGYLLLELCIRALTGDARTRVLSLILLYFIFVIDLFEVLLPLGNTPLTYIIWLLIGLSMSPKTRVKRSGVSSGAAYVPDPA